MIAINLHYNIVDRSQGGPARVGRGLDADPGGLGALAAVVPVVPVLAHFNHWPTKLRSCIHCVWKQFIIFMKLLISTHIINTINFFFVDRIAVGTQKKPIHSSLENKFG